LFWKYRFLSETKFCIGYCVGCYLLKLNKQENFKFSFLLSLIRWIWFWCFRRYKWYQTSLVLPLDQNFEKAGWAGKRLSWEVYNPSYYKWKPDRTRYGQIKALSSTIWMLYNNILIVQHICRTLCDLILFFFISFKT
jgi:hypothetical protein